MTPERPSNAASPGTKILKSIKELPWWQRILVKLFGLALLVVPAYAGVQLVPHFVHEDTSWILALVLLGFLSLLMFIGLMITVPRIGTFVAGLIPMPEKWRRLMERR